MSGMKFIRQVLYLIVNLSLFKKKKMFHHKNNQSPVMKVNNMGLDILKPLTQLVDETTFLENLNELYQHLGVRQLDPASQTYKELRTYLTQVLQYPNKSLAKLHRQSHRLGGFDKLIHSNANNHSNQFQQANLIDQIDNCPCCGLKKQIEELKICSTSFKDLEIIGISTYMFFRTLRNLIYFLIVAMIIFGAFSFASNIKCSNIWNDDDTNGRLLDFKNTIMISLGSKIYLSLNDEYTDLLIWQVWLGLVMVVLFMVGYVWMQRIEVNQINEIDYQTKSISNYSVVVKGVPIGITEKNLQSAIDSIFPKQLQQISHQIVKINSGTPIKINSEVKHQYEDQLIKLHNKNQQYRKQIFSWIIELSQHGQFITPLSKRQQIVSKFHENVKQYKLKQQQIVARIKELHKQNKIDTIDCFVTFESKKAKQHLLDSISYGAFDKFLQYLTFNVYKKTIRLQLGQQGEKQEYKCKIQQASQPQDIMWQNMGMNTMDLIFRKCITFLSTFILLGMSFAVVYGLSTVQVKNESNVYISFLISLTIVVFNWIITFVLALLTAQELNSTHTDYQSSYAVKTIFAQLLNTILIPILVNRFLKRENYIYSTSGLADDVFLLGLTGAFVKPLLTIFDPYFLYIKYLKVWLSDKPHDKVLLNQVQFNRIHELMLFQTGTQYIYIISVYLWTCFFMSLQPVIIAFTILGFLLNYWAIKYSLFHRCKRPVPGTRILYDTMVQFVYAGGLFYSLGSLTFINLIPKDVFLTELNFALIANIIAIGISALSLFIPFSYLYALFFESKSYEEDELYEQNRIFFPSEYDRMNPTTSQQAINEYLRFVNDKKMEIRKRYQDNDSKMKQFLVALSNQSRNVYTRSFDEFNPMRNLFSGGNKLAELFKPRIEMVHPHDIENYLVCDLYDSLMGGKSNHLKMRGKSSHPTNDTIGKMLVNGNGFQGNQGGSDDRLCINNLQNQALDKDVNFPSPLNQILLHKVTAMADPLQNHMSYTKSPYSPSILEQFKREINRTFINKHISSYLHHQENKG